MVHGNNPRIERPTIQPPPPPIESLLPLPFSAPPVPRPAAVLQLDPYSMVAVHTFAGRGLREAMCLGKRIREGVNVKEDTCDSSSILNLPPSMSTVKISSPS
jgi:hypothetical protein